VPTVAASDGAVLAYDVRGSGPTDLLLLHGAPGTRSYFDNLIGALDTTRARAIVMDIRGHGDSGGEDAEYTLEQLTADTLAVADAAGANETVVLGFSMGAKFAQHLALTAPGRVAGLILVAGCPAGELPVPRELLNDWYSRIGDAERLAALVVEYARTAIDPADLEAVSRNAARASRAAFEGSLNLTIESSFSDEVGAIAAPTLVVGGAADPFFTPDFLRHDVVEPLQRARLVVLEGGHHLPLELTSELAALVEAFLAGLAL
jgi:pimeloyl-ACP methyl ester carboxylesterase